MVEVENKNRNSKSRGVGPVSEYYCAFDKGIGYGEMKEKALHLTTEEFKKWWLSEYTQRKVKKFLKKYRKIDTKVFLQLFSL